MGELHRHQGPGRDERPHLDDADVVEALRHAVPHTPPAEVREQHLAAIAEAAAAAGHDVPDTVPAGWVQRWSSRARRVVALTAVKVGLSGAAVALAAGGGLAATGNLPDPAQRVVADVAERVGVDLPRPAADRPAGQDVDGAPERPVTPRVEQPGPADERAERTVDPDRVQDQQRPDEPASRRPAEGDGVEGEDVREDPPASDVAPVEPGVPDHAEDDAASSQGDERDPSEERRERQGDSGEQQAPGEGSTSSSSGPATEGEDADANEADSGSAPGVAGDAGSAPADADGEPDSVNP